MNDMDKKRILVVAGDYEIIQKASEILTEGDFNVQAAFSYRDALQMLETEHFDVVLLDAVMTDRKSGEPVVKLLETYHVAPVVLLARNGAVPAYQQPPVQMVLGALDKRTLLRGILSVLNIPLIHEKFIQSEQNSRVEEIETLFSLGKSLTEVLELSEVLNRVVASARYLTNAEEGMILLPDDELGQLYLRAKVGIDEETAQNFRIKTEDSVAGNVFHSGQAALIGAQGLQKVKTQYFVKSLLYVPILLQGKPIGVLGVNNIEADDVFDTNDQELLLNLASYAAIAIENARVHEETLQRTWELESLVEASHAVNASISLETALPNICEQLARVLNVTWTEIHEWDLDKQQLRLMARYQCSSWRSGQGPVVRLDHHPALRSALDENRSLQVTREGAGIAGQALYLEKMGVHTMLLIPVHADKQILGAVRAYFIDPPGRTYAQDVIQHVQRLALEGMVLASNNFNSAESRQVMRITEDINQLVAADWTELTLLEAKKQSLTVQASVGSGVWVRHPYSIMDLDRYPELLEVLDTQKHVAQSASRSRNDTQVLLEMNRSLGILALPLVQRGQTQGVVLFGDTRSNRAFSEREINLGRAIVGQAATALENANLVHDLELSLQELKDTQDRLVQTARLSAMGELAAAVAHQINNPLTTILVDTELMLLDEPPESRNFKSLQAISRAGKRAAGVVRRLLATARPTEENAPVEAIDLIDTIEGILSLVRSHIEQDRIRLLSNLPNERIPSVPAVQGQLDDIWLNLLLNAHDALVGRPDAQIGIEVFYQPKQAFVDVVVWDNGPGIPPEIVESIFKPFFTTKPVGEGTGLGLHISRQVVERVGGHIFVESAANEGTRFIVRLPVGKGIE